MPENVITYLKYLGAFFLHLIFVASFFYFFFKNIFQFFLMCSSSGVGYKMMGTNLLGP